MAGNCIEDGCGIDLSVTLAGALKADAKISASACNAITCNPGLGPAGGLFAYEDESLVQSGTLPGTESTPSGPTGWSIDIFAAGLGTFEVSSAPYAAGGAMVDHLFTNESACLAANMMSVVTAREVLYVGDAGARFMVNYQADENGGGFLDMFNITSDYRFAQTVVAPVDDSRPGGAGAGGRVLAPAATYTYKYRILLTVLDAPAAAGVVSSPGLTFCHLSMTN